MSTKRNFNIDSSPVRVDKEIYEEVSLYADRTGTTIRAFYDKAAKEKLSRLKPAKKSNAKVKNAKG